MYSFVTSWRGKILPRNYCSITSLSFSPLSALSIFLLNLPISPRTISTLSESSFCRVPRSSRDLRAVEVSFAKVELNLVVVAERELTVEESEEATSDLDARSLSTVTRSEDDQSSFWISCAHRDGELTSSRFLFEFLLFRSQTLLQPIEVSLPTVLHTPHSVPQILVFHLDSLEFFSRFLLTLFQVFRTRFMCRDIRLVFSL